MGDKGFSQHIMRKNKTVEMKFLRSHAEYTSYDRKTNPGDKSRAKYMKFKRK
jgi:hypothetical protein